MDLTPIGRRIKSARQNANLTQDELASMTGLSPTHISCIERGVKPPKLDTFIHIANILDVSSDVLLQDVLDQAGDPLAAELAASIHRMPEQDQHRALKIIRALSAPD